MSTRTRTLSAILILLFFSIYSNAIEAAEIPLEKDGGVFTLSVKINGVITLKFILDSGASEVVIPADVALTLIRTGTIRDSDFLAGSYYTLADGSKLKSARFVIRELEFGGIKINNVPCSVTPPAGDLLLGQSLLEKFDSWTLDNKRHVLIVGSAAVPPPPPKGGSLDKPKTIPPLPVKSGLEHPQPSMKSKEPEPQISSVEQSAFGSFKFISKKQTEKNVYDFQLREGNRTIYSNEL